MKKKHLKQVQNQAQEGRSMVEMLGVLAIIGVISIGGIAGYHWGMDKHVSNQILYEMNLNSTQLAMLLQKGNPEGVTLSLGSPYDDAEPRYRTVDYGFDYGCEEEVEGELHKCFNPDETGYFISALNLPERIANMVIESAPNLQYYVDYEETVADEVENKTDVTIFFDINADATESLPDSEVTQPETTTLPETTTDKCENNDDCKRLKGSDDYYCRSSGCSDSCNESACTLFKCVKISDDDIVQGNVNGNDYYGSKTRMNWWSAKRFCEAAARMVGGSGSMVSWGDSGIDWKCYQDNDAPDPINKNPGYCKATSDHWGIDNVSETIKDFREMWSCDREITNNETCNTIYPWLEDEDPSCDTYLFTLNSGRVNHHLRYDGHNAFCK